MGLSEGEGEDAEMSRRFEELCTGELNTDARAREEAWQSFQRIRDNYTLEVVRYNGCNGSISD